MSASLPTRWVRDHEGLTGLADALGSVDTIALDSESDSGFHYTERLCLLQLNDGRSIWLVDLLALEGGRYAIEALRAVLEDPMRTKLLHGGEFDVGCFKRDFGIGLRGVWDTQQAATFLGLEKTSYAAMVERYCGVLLPKAHTRHDWSRRPIEGEVLAYAVNDVLYLPRVASSLRTEVERADLLDEVAIASEAVEQATWNGGFKPEGLWSIKGVRQLSESQQQTLMALYCWREDLARDLDLPPGRALNNEVLLALSRHPPVRLEELRRLGVPRRLGPQWSADLLRVVAESRLEPPDLPPAPVRAPSDPRARKRGERLKSWRREEAERRRVAPQVVLPVTAMRFLTQHGAEDLEAVPQLGAKRIRLYGEVLRELTSSRT